MSRSDMNPNQQDKADPFMLWTWDIESNTFQYSQELGSPYNQSQQLDWSAWLGRIHPDDQSRVSKAWQELPLSWQDELSFLGVNHLYYRVKAQAQLWTEAGKPVRMVGSFQEIKKEPEKAILEEEEYLHFALMSAGLGTWDFDPISEIVRWDERCNKLHGFAEGSVVTYAEVLAYIHPEDRSRVEKAVSRALDPRLRDTYDIIFRTIGAEDGRLRWLHCRGQAYFNEQNQPYRFSGTTQDVTEQTVKEGVFKAIEQKYQSVFTGAEVGIAILSTDGFFQLVNPAMAAFVGYQIGELLGKHFKMITPLEEIERDEQVAQELFLGIRRARTVDKRYLHKNGNLVWGRLTVSLIRSESNDPVSFVAIVQKITEEKEIQLALQDSERRFRNLVIDTPTATVVFTGRSMKIEVVNDAMLQIWGKTLKEVQGKILHDVMPELIDQPFLELLQNVYDTGIPYRNPEGKANIMVDGVLKTSWFNFSYNPVYDADGRIYGVINTATDVTFQVAARLQIKEAEENLRSAVDIAQLGTWSYNPLTDQVYYSDRIKSWFGFSEEDLEIKDALCAVHLKDRERVKNAIARALLPESDGIYDEEYTVVNQVTGEERILHARAHVLYNEQCEAYLLTGTAQDITPLKQLAEELERQVKERTLALNRMNLDLQQTNASLEQFAYAASHDLQEPLRKIQSFISLIEVHEKNHLTDRGKVLLERIQASCQRMTTLIRDLLSFSQLSNDQLQFSSVNLNQLIKDVLLDLELSIQEKKASFMMDDLPFIWGNAQQIAQLLQNLLTNALKFSHPDRPIQINISGGKLETPANLPLLQADTSYIWLKVEDNGIGFEEEYSEKIFQMFQRLHSRDQYAGTGIGLALCRKVVENHRGYIEAHSVLGEGATFTIYLPSDSQS
ncbi:PAS domain S-box protein [Siphonobacter sp. SORGH_AS_0500]|uniref:PAS domain-containing sensor histidine kinase n=1 Tax=Siphonobacter sp. SORGH_AS_0500 TaxID=1864824 RepID=UPI0028660DA9|nr:PAS domain S-box protein [Siphonobacter sp. SORGH_AS_0500]MDR6197213.1 PAS domain S-box-containing protein [Siphonobacter sp. SORGH_AS_0500]